MGKIALSLMYDGTYFHGWQVQKNAVTVQQTVQDALQRLLGFRPDVSGCSRTDSGVHANMYVCHIDSDGVQIPPEKLPMAINAYLPSAIAVFDASLKGDDFHARYSCKGKEYIYKIWNAGYRNPFLDGKCMFVPRYLDIETAKFCENEFVGKHDFSAFMSQGAKSTVAEDPVRTVMYFNVRREGNLITVTVAADGFLYNMVRIMVGTYIECALGRLHEGDVTAIIDSKNRAEAGDTAPACGLYLNRVFY